MGKALAKLFAASFDNVIIVSRDVQKAKELMDDITQPSLKYLPLNSAIRQADIIIPALWYTDELVFAKQNAGLLKGKIYFNISVPFTESFDDLLLPYGSSAAEVIQQHLPATTVAGIFKTVFWPLFNSPLLLNNAPDVYVTSDDELTRKQLLNFLHPLPFRFVDAGTLAENRTIERMTLLSRKLGISNGFYPNIAFKLWNQKG